jgi:hypothetical protein
LRSLGSALLRASCPAPFGPFRYAQRSNLLPANWSATRPPLRKSFFALHHCHDQRQCGNSAGRKDSGRQNWGKALGATYLLYFDESSSPRSS